MDRVRAMLRSGDWLSRERVRLVAVTLLVASVAGFLFLVATAHGDVDRQGRPLGTDFSNVYAAGTYVLEGNPDAPFDPPTQYAREQALFGKSTPFYGWHYPPYFLFIAGALARMPYGVALAVWQASTLALYLLMMWGIVFPSPRVAGRGVILLLALAYPAVLINIGHGQNGFLTAALLGGALVLLDRRPIVAGILIGLLVYKPQFGLMIPLALIAGGRWRSFASAAATFAALTLVTTIAFGPHVWHAFQLSTVYSRTVVLEQGDTGWQKIQSVFSWARMWGAPVALAYALQSALTLALGVAIFRLWRSAAAPAVKSAALCIAAILATPYSLDYDMMVLAPAIAFFAVDGVMRGFHPWERTALAVLWLVPLVTRSVAQATLIPLGVPAMLASFALLLRRAELHRGVPLALASASAKMAQHGASPSHDIAAFE
ncbi:MAG TPA: glycosyltransferase family 87 protein [Xanthobacteraceae bacterium]|nr:glycosyltransferase family 87 protein [Xanthobacteraceae bacterium]